MELMIEDIKLFHVLSYVNTKFSNLNNYNVLIGKKNSGKSNLFKIIKILKINYQTGVFSARYLYEKNKEFGTSITFCFKLSKLFRKKLFSKLYFGHYLDNAFRSSENREGSLVEREWRNKNIALQWLMDEGFYSKLIVEISYSNTMENIYISQISVKHKKNENVQILLNTKTKEGAHNYFISDISQPNCKDKTIQNFFSDFPPKRIGQNIVSIRVFFDNSHLFSTHPILSPLLELLSSNFFDSVFLIPDKRVFKRDSDIKKITQTILEPNGENFPKFIHMKKVTNNDKWLQDFNQELIQFFPDVIKLGQMVDQNDKTYLTFKERDIDIELQLENMGAGILNVAHFLACLMELKENKILFIEEPELFLHPGLEKKLRDKFIRISDKIQIFITTHSREFVPENNDRCSVHLIKKQNCQSVATQIPKEKYYEIYRNLDVDIDKYILQKSLIYNEDFWIRFVKKSMEDNRIEADLWDFKQTLDMWKIQEPQENIKSKIKFCQHIASFANNQGGVLIIGISNRIPRSIIGLDYDNLES